MWIFLYDSMLSIVQNLDDETGDTLLVRARITGDIEKIFPDAKVIKGAGSDYLFRAVVPRQDVIEAISHEIEGIDYGNFKNATDTKMRHDAYLDVWLAMVRYQSKKEGVGYVGIYGSFPDGNEEYEDQLHELDKTKPETT